QQESLRRDPTGSQLVAIRPRQGLPARRQTNLAEVPPVSPRTPHYRRRIRTGLQSTDVHRLPATRDELAGAKPLTIAIIPVPLPTRLPCRSQAKAGHWLATPKSNEGGSHVRAETNRPWRVPRHCFWQRQ